MNFMDDNIQNLECSIVILKKHFKKLLAPKKSILIYLIAM